MIPSKRNRTRRVHFAENCISFAPITSHRTPSPTLSDSSFQSESDPPTPPLAAQYIPSPYPFGSTALFTSPASSTGLSLSPPSVPHTHLTIGLPTPTPSPPNSVSYATKAPASTSMNIHYLLAYSPFSMSPLNYNILQPPPPDLLDEPATNPPLAQMVITFPLLPAAWEIKIVPGMAPTSLNATDGFFSPAANAHAALHGSPEQSPSRGYITILDVLYGLHTSLRTILHPSEYHSIVSIPPFSEDAVTAAFWARLALIEDPNKKEEQRRRGIRRVDFLGARTRFLGLAGTLKGDVWELGLGHAN
ncbi:hypothetical protein AX14_012225 [Amanita brunnescens Koide BX004]|nr:hypothetical protein AX14_012225 [Amanita brunnescens Koide BX004]